MARDLTMFVAVFCPNCGTCVNEPPIEVDPVPASSSLVNCYWCKGRHGIDQVIVCRRLGHIAQAQRMEGMRLRLLDVRRRLNPLESALQSRQNPD